MKLKISSVSFIVLGITSFVFGLLAILHENSVFVELAQLFSGTQAAEAVGVLLLFAGQGLLVFGVIKLTTSKFSENWQSDRQLLTTGYNQTLTRLDTLEANQRIVAASSTKLQTSNCKFCGAKIEQGPFCSACGKAN